MDTTKKKESARCCPGGWRCKVCGPRRKERKIIRKAVRKVTKTELLGNTEDIEDDCGYILPKPYLSSSSITSLKRADSYNPMISFSDYWGKLK